MALVSGAEPKDPSRCQPIGMVMWRRMPPVRGAQRFDVVQTGCCSTNMACGDQFVPGVGKAMGMPNVATRQVFLCEWFNCFPRDAGQCGVVFPLYRLELLLYRRASSDSRADLRLQAFDS